MNMEMTRDELNKMTKRDLIEHSNQYGVHPNRKSIPKGLLIDLIIHHGFNRPPPKREVMQRRTLRFNRPPSEAELNQLDYSEEEQYGTCDVCSSEGKFIGKKGDEWTCWHCENEVSDSDKSKSEEVKDDSEGYLNQLD